MRKSILIALALALFAGTASAKLGDLVASFPNQPTSPRTTHYGLAADANYLYSFFYYSTYRYPTIRMRRTTGAFVSSWPNPLGTAAGQYYIRGLSYDGLGHLYYNNYSQRRVGRARASNGAMVSSWTWPVGTTRYGICVDHGGTSGGTNIYQNMTTNLWWVSTLTGSLKRAYRAPRSNYSFDLAWDYGNKLIWYSNYSEDYIYGVLPATNSVKAKFALPVGPDNGYGIAYWGNYLYVSTISGTPDEYIWVFHCPANVTVAPASVGRVKALFQ